MKLPLYALLIAPDPDQRLAIAKGHLSVTVRAGRRDYREGQPVMLCCHLAPWAVMADITQVKHLALEQVSIGDVRDMGYRDHNALYTALRVFYPDIRPSSSVTVIRWNNVRGTLTERP